MPDVQAADSSSAPFVPSDSQRTVDAIPPSERENWRLKGTPFPKLTEPSEGESADTPAAEPVEQVVSTETQVPPASEPGTGAKPRKGIKQRLPELDADIQELNARLDEIRSLKRQIAEERQPAQVQAQPEAKPQQTAAPFPDFGTWLTKPENAAKQYEDYIDARSDYRTEQKWNEKEQSSLAQRQLQEFQQTVESRTKAHIERLNTALNADAQFYDRVRPELSKNDVRYTPVDLLPEGHRPTIQNVIGQEIFQSEKGPQIMRYLTDHEDEWKTLNGSRSYGDVIRRIGFIEGQLKSPAKYSRQISGAPPVSAVQIGRSQSEPVDEAKAALKTDDFRRYKAIMNARDIAKAK